MRTIILAFLTIGVFCHAGEFENHIHDGDLKIDYSVYVPSNLGCEKSPLIVFLHGSGVRGSTPEVVQKKGVGIMIEDRSAPAFFILFPQCPKEHTWKDEEIMESVVLTIAEVCKTYDIDQDRIYLTGNSLGGIGTWYLACYSPTTFAAIAPLSGYAELEDPSKLKDLPIWAFHGGLDDVIPLELAEKTVASVKKYNPRVEFTVYPKDGHGPWKHIYKNPEFYTWLLKQEKSNKSVELTSEPPAHP